MGTVSCHEKMAMAHNAIRFILEDLERMLGPSRSVSGLTNMINKTPFASVCEDLIFIRSFLERFPETSLYLYPDIQELAGDIEAVVRELLVYTNKLFESYSSSNTSLTEIIGPSVRLLLSSLEDNERFKSDLEIAYLDKRTVIAGLVEGIKWAQRYDHHCNDDSINGDRDAPIEMFSKMEEDTVMVGLDDETRELQDELIGGRNRLDVISVVGMAGIGKTTLAKRLYNDLSIVYHFHIRAWTSVSQVYRKRKVLYSILNSILNTEDPILQMSDEDMGEKLYKCLKGRRYLIVIDDIWDIEVWNDLEQYFPKDDNRSRILLTSRIKNVPSKIRPDSSLHFLRFLSQEESWNLFTQKVFGQRSFPEELREIGNRIVAKCKGLPLAIVVIAGFLAREKKTKEWWRQVSETIGSSIHNDSQEFMSLLTLSYNHLPRPLKSCFLYIGSFPEDYEIPVRNLIQSWIAEGFIEQTNEKRLEDVAEDYLMDLVNRSLVIVAKKRSDGGVKSCQIHDALRDLCLKKAKERKFVLPICNCGPNTIPFNPIRAIYARSFIGGTDPNFSKCQHFHSFDSHYANFVFTNETLAVYELLRSLDLRHLVLDIFPGTMLRLRHLKHLALQLERIKNLPPFFLQLWNLETCILIAEKGGKVTLPWDILKMEKLRHLKVSPELHFEAGNVFNKLSDFLRKLASKYKRSAPIGILENLQTLSQLYPSASTTSELLRRIGILENLQTLSQLYPSASTTSELLRRTPNLRKLAFHLTPSSSTSGRQRPSSAFSVNLSALGHLQTLKFEYQTYGMVRVSIPPLAMFPPRLKKVTLIGSHVDWGEVSTIGRLPRLEVLKIQDNFFSGPHWETRDDEFPCLKFLKLCHMDLQEWVASDDAFPRLEKLVLRGCFMAIPSRLGEVVSLNSIEVYESSYSTVTSAHEIRESQVSNIGNNDFNLFVLDHFQEC